MAFRVTNFSGAEALGFGNMAVDSANLPTRLPTAGRMNTGLFTWSFGGNDEFLIDFRTSDGPPADDGDQGGHYIVKFHYAFQNTDHQVDTPQVAFQHEEGANVGWQLEMQTDGTWDLLDTSGSVIETLTMPTPSVAHEYHEVMVRFTVGASAEIQVWVDGSTSGNNTAQDTSGPTTTNNHGMRIFGVSGTGGLSVDDIVMCEGSTAASDATDTISGAVVTGYGVGSVTATPDFEATSGDDTGQPDLDSGTWDGTGDNTNATGTEAEYNGGAQAGASACDVAQGTPGQDGLRTGPSGDSEVSGTVLAGKLTGFVVRGNGSGTTHTLYMGSWDGSASGAGAADISGIVVTLATTPDPPTTPFIACVDVNDAADGANVPGTGDFAVLGFGKSTGGREIVCQELSYSLLFVPAVSGFVDMDGDADQVMSNPAMLNQTRPIEGDMSSTLTPVGMLNQDRPLEGDVAFALTNAGHIENNIEFTPSGGDDIIVVDFEGKNADDKGPKTLPSTVGSSVVVSTEEPRFGLWSGHFSPLNDSDANSLISYSGQDSSCSLGDSPTEDWNLEVSAWFDDLTRTVQVICGQTGTTSAHQRWRIERNAGDIIFRGYDGSGVEQVTVLGTPASLTVGNWNDITVNYDHNTDTYRLFVGTVRLAQIVDASGWGGADHPWILGQDRSESATQFDGKIDQINADKGKVKHTGGNRPAFVGPDTFLLSTAGALEILKDIDGDMNAVLSPNSALDAQQGLTGDIPASLTLNAALNRIRPLEGDITTSLTLNAALNNIRLLDGDVSTALTLNAALNNIRELDGSFTSTLALNAALNVLKDMDGDVVTALTLNAAMNVVRDICGTVPMSLTTSAALNVLTSICGTVSFSLLNVGDLDIPGGASFVDMDGDADQVLTLNAALNQIRPLEGDTVFALTLNGDLQALVEMSGNVNISLTLNGALNVIRDLCGDANFSLGTSGALNVIREICGDVIANLTTSAQVGVTFDLGGSTSFSSSLQGSINIFAGMTGGLQAALTLQGDINVIRDISGNVNFTLTTVSDMNKIIGLHGSMDAVLEALGCLEGVADIILEIGDAAVKLREKQGAAVKIGSTGGAKINL